MPYLSAIALCADSSVLDVSTAQHCIATGVARERRLLHGSDIAAAGDLAAAAHTIIISEASTQLLNPAP
eukprot:2836921-Rhodomonas_salina.3